jgi:hypothetical protein
MARNDPNHPELARAAQDIEAPIPREGEGPHHFGRGGAANVVANQGERKSGDAQRENSNGSEAKGLVGKGKELLNKLGGKK